MDSGSCHAMSSATSIGTMAPATNNACQPYCGTSHAAIIAGIPLPSDMPMMGMLVSRARRAAGEISAVSAITFGSTPPRPRQ